MKFQKAELRIVKNSGVGNQTQRATENNRLEKHSQEAESQPNQGKFPHLGFHGLDWILEFI
jgi:hypothetical protein